ncbi:MAG TPA: hypothetical protein PK544_04665 [Spirochaetota bacterium]|nr:hypothetical protein [Spirochaetota bacterium]HPJ39809.1 hypothetical protein [Spirochaetota bacterium]HPQ52714.1 hypothetical protein [Spirochaetota bacterium]
MEKCISCGTPTDRTFIMYECRIGDIEKIETRTEYIPTNFKPQKRVHYKVITSYDETTEHVFGYCSNCLYKSRKTGLKLLMIFFPALFIPSAVLFFVSGGLSAERSGLFWVSLVLGFAAALTFFTSLHFIFSSNKKSPYYAKKSELNDLYMETHNCKIFTPKEFEYLKKNDFRETKTTFSDILS